MKLTKTRLKQIIKEEIENILVNENFFGLPKWMVPDSLEVMKLKKKREKCHREIVSDPRYSVGEKKQLQNKCDEDYESAKQALGT